MPCQRIEIRPSARLATFLSLAHLGAAVAIWCAALPVWAKAASTIAIAAGLGWSLFSRAALRAGASIVAVEITTEGRVSIGTRRGTWHACEPLGTSYVSPALTIVNLEVEGFSLPRHVVLVPGNVNARDFRRLRTWLRWARRA
jgi:toxin CptA